VISIICEPTRRSSLSAGDCRTAERTCAHSRPVSRWENAPTPRQIIGPGQVMIDLYCARYATAPAPSRLTSTIRSTWCTISSSFRYCRRCFRKSDCLTFMVRGSDSPSDFPAARGQRNGTNINGAVSATYTAPGTTTADMGATFDVMVSNSAGTAISSAATFTVNAAIGAPTITVQPVSQTVTAGQTATFTVPATSYGPLLASGGRMERISPEPSAPATPLPPQQRRITERSSTLWRPRSDQGAQRSRRLSPFGHNPAVMAIATDGDPRLRPVRAYRSRSATR
jgi:hypothetical protein